MNVISRGIRNAFRNVIRTLSLVLILGLSIGLSLTMLIAHQAVAKKIAQVKASIGNTVTIQPAGFNDFSQVNNALTTTELHSVSSLPHVTGVAETLTDRLTTIGAASLPIGRQSNANTNNTTNLTSPIQLNVNGGGGGGRGVRLFIAGGGALPSNFSPPISIVGTTSPLHSTDSESIRLTSGNSISGSQDTNDALISDGMASKNNLKVGATFTAYGNTLTVAGIFKGGTQTVTNDIIVALPTEQRLSGQNGAVTTALATVDSLDNLSLTTSAISKSLGSSADVTSSETQADQAVQPLNNVKNISLYSLVGAVVAGSVIILMTMVMIVRERKREIGVLKAIGASNLRIMLQFMTEALTLTILAAFVGLIIGFAGASPVTNTLVTNSANTGSFPAAPGNGPPAQGGGFGLRHFVGDAPKGTLRNLGNIHAEVGWSMLLYGFGAAVFIAVIGSALATGLIAKVRPSEVMRVE